MRDYFENQGGGSFQNQGVDQIQGIDQKSINQGDRSKIKGGGHLKINGRSFRKSTWVGGRSKLREESFKNQGGITQK